MPPFPKKHPKYKPPGGPVEAGKKVPTSESGPGSGERGMGSTPSSFSPPGLEGKKPGAHYSDPSIEKGIREEDSLSLLPSVSNVIEKDQSREGIQSQLMGRTGSPTMEAGTIGGAGLSALGGMASGNVSAGMQAQHDNTLRAIAAQRAGSRGPVGLAERSATAATGLSGAQLAGEAGKQQFQAAQAEAAAQAQQADMNQRANEVNLQVEKELSIARDELISKYSQMGLTEEQYKAQIEADLEKLKHQLNYDYWRQSIEQSTALDVAAMQNIDDIGRIKPSPWVPGFRQDTGEFREQYLGPGAYSGKAEDDLTATLSEDDPLYAYMEQLEKEKKAEAAASRGFMGTPGSAGGPEDDDTQSGGPEDDDSIPDDELDSGEGNNGQTLRNIEAGLGLGAGAYDLLTAKGKEDQKRAALGIVKSPGAALVTKYLSDKIGNTAAGGVVGAGTSMASAALDDSNKVGSREKQIAHAGAKSTAQSLGAAGGSKALSSLALMSGPAAAALTPVAHTVGGALGGWAGGKIHDAISPGPREKTSTDVQEMIANRMGPRERALDPASSGVGGPEDAMEPPEMPIPSNSSYDFLENISASKTEEPDQAAGLSGSKTMSALGDLHERLKEIESVLGTSQNVGVV